MMNAKQLSLDEAIMSNQNLIYALTKHYDYRLQDDLFQVGVVGLIDAYNHYDVNYNTKFSSYAYPYIVGEIKKYIREDRNIKISRDVIYLCSKIEKTRVILQQKMHKEPSTSDLSSFLEIDESKIIEALQINSYVRSIDEPLNDEGKELTLKDMISERENYDKIDLISLRDELNRLSPKERHIIEQRYYDDRTQCETAAIMGLSQVDVSRTERKLILSLKDRLQ
ncbi:MAG: sigma-70 family RNA polymerase sigma factor [Bacilli bacterium]|jgi:RNA polymerase sporulation-specific sigma factor